MEFLSLKVLSSEFVDELVSGCFTQCSFSSKKYNLWPLVIPVSCIVWQVPKSFQTPSLFRYLLSITASVVGEWEIQVTVDLLLPFVVCIFLCDGITSILKESSCKLFGGFYFSSEFWLKCISEGIGKPWRRSGKCVNSRTYHSKFSWSLFLNCLKEGVLSHRSQVKNLELNSTCPAVTAWCAATDWVCNWGSKCCTYLSQWIWAF